MNNSYKEPILVPAVVIFHSEKFGDYRRRRIIKSIERMKKFYNYGMDIMIGNEKKIIQHSLKKLCN